MCSTGVGGSVGVWRGGVAVSPPGTDTAVAVAVGGNAVDVGAVGVGAGDVVLLLAGTRPAGTVTAADAG